MFALNCLACKGSGVDGTDDCEECDGSGEAKCERTTCKEKAITVNEDGEALCEDCAFEEAC